MKHSTTAPEKPPKGSPLKLLCASLIGVGLLLLLFLNTGSSFALLIDSTDPLENTFSLSEVSTTIKEDLSDTKKNVSVANTGDCSIWVRVSLSATWIDAEGNTVAQSPQEGEDYLVTLADSASWLIGLDGFYYYSLPLDPNEETDALIELIALSDEGEQNAAQNDWSLSVSIISSGLQAQPEQTFDSVWGDSSGLYVSNNVLTF